MGFAPKWPGRHCRNFEDIHRFLHIIKKGMCKMIFENITAIGSVWLTSRRWKVFLLIPCSRQGKLGSWPLGQNLPTCPASPRGGDRAGVHNIQDIFMKFLTHNSEGLSNVSCKHHINITRFGFTANFTARAGIKGSLTVITFHTQTCKSVKNFIGSGSGKTAGIFALFQVLLWPKRYRSWKSQNCLYLYKILMIVIIYPWNL